MDRAKPKPRAQLTPRDAPAPIYTNDPNVRAMRYRRNFTVSKPGGGHMTIFVSQIPPQTP